MVGRIFKWQGKIKINRKTWNPIMDKCIMNINRLKTLFSRQLIQFKCYNLDWRIRWLNRLFGRISRLHCTLNIRKEFIPVLFPRGFHFQDHKHGEKQGGTQSSSEAYDNLIVFHFLSYYSADDVIKCFFFCAILNKLFYTSAGNLCFSTISIIFNYLTVEKNKMTEKDMETVIDNLIASFSLTAPVRLFRYTIWWETL